MHNKERKLCRPTQKNKKWFLKVRQNNRSIKAYGFSSGRFSDGDHRLVETTYPILSQIDISRSRFTLHLRE